MSVYELAKRYYPRLWNKSRLESLVEAGRLTEEEFREITSQEGAATNGHTDHASGA